MSKRVAGRLTAAVSLAVTALLVASSLPALAAPTPTTITLSTSAASGLAGSTVTLSGRVTPYAKIGFVLLQIAGSDGKWKTVLPLAAGASTQGAFTHDITLAAKADSEFRVIRGATATFAAGISNHVRVTTVTRRYLVTAHASTGIVPDGGKVAIKGTTTLSGLKPGTPAGTAVVYLQTYASKTWTSVAHVTAPHGVFVFTVVLHQGTTIFRVLRPSTSSVAAGFSKTLTVEADSPHIVTTQLPPGAIGVPYKQTIMIEDGTVPYSFSSTDVGLGLHLSANLLFGTPDATGTVPITLKVTDARGFSNTKTLTVSVKGLRALAWGANDKGQLGNAGATGSTPTPTTSLIPATTVQISSGNGFSLARQADGTVYSWGTNAQGQLGLGNTTDQSAPQQIPYLGNVAEVVAGYRSAYAVTAQGQVYAWGANELGQLGDGTTKYQNTPELLAGVSGILKLVAGDDFALAMDVSGGIFSWGTNTVSQTGVPPANLDHLSPQYFFINAGVGVFPIDIQAGGATGYALENNNTVWAWGGDGFGALGDGNPSENAGAGVAPRQIAGVANVTSLTCSVYDCYAQETDGSTWSWGDSRDGALGRGMNTNPLPAPIPGLVNVAQIASRGDTVYALLLDGTVDSWGNNSSGELASTQPYFAVPTPIPSISGAVQVAAGFGVGYALTAG